MLPARLKPSLFKASKLSAFITLASLSIGSFGDNIYQVYQDAVANDPIIRAAAATLRAEQELKNVAFGQMLPQVGIEFNYIDSTEDNTPVAAQSSTEQTSNGYNIGITQNILDLSVWYQFKSASELSEQAELDFRSNEQKLITRTVESYFKVLRAYDNLASSLAEEAAFQQQLDQTQQRFDVGLVAITDVNESQAAYDLAKVNRLANQGILQTAYENLTLLTGKVYSHISLVSDDLPIRDPIPADRKSWVEMSAKGNLELLSAEYATNAAKYKYKQAASGHLPTVGLTYNQSERNITDGQISVLGQGTIDIDDYETTYGDTPAFGTKTVSLSLKLPLFTGGSTSANRRRAFAQFDSAQEQLSGTQRSVIQTTRANHIAVQTQIQTVAARKQAITSSQSAVDAIEAGYQVGTRNIVDVLNAQRNLYNAQRDYANARYDYIEAMFELKLSAGLLSAGDIQTLNQFMMVDKPATEQAAIEALNQANQ